MTEYRLALANLGTSGLGSVIISDVLGTIGVPERQKLTFTEELNGHGSLEFTLPIDEDPVTVANFNVGAREVHLYRKAGGVETLVWGGKLWVADVSGWEVRFQAYGWMFDFERRFVNGDYAQVKDQFAIAKDMVQYTQGRDGDPWNQPASADLGITVEPGGSGVVRRGIICIEERQTVLDVIRDLAAAEDGFDFEVTPDKVFRMFSPFRTRSATLTFTGANNIMDFGYQQDASELATDMWALGEDDDCAIPAIYNAFDATARTTYGLLESVAELESGGRTQHKEQAHMEKIADRELELNKEPRWQPTFDVPTSLQGPVTGINFNQVMLGDSVNLDTARGPSGGFGDLSRVFRVISRKVSVGPTGSEHVALGLDSVIPS